MNRPESAPLLHTHSGRQFNLASPSAKDVCIEDIAHNLSRLCRFTGAVACVHYSVAQHSVLVAQKCGCADAFWGLLHDASEAYTGDINKPLKDMCAQLKEIERGIQAAICEKFGLPREEPSAVIVSDMRMLVTERRDLLAPPSFSWGGIEAYEPYDEEIEPWTQEQAEHMFLAHFRVLSGDWVEQCLRSSDD